MKSKSNSIKIIDDFFKNKFVSEDARKIKRLAMSHRIKLGKLRTQFCKKCYSDLKTGKTRITKTHKTVTCKCGFVNKFKIS